MVSEGEPGKGLHAVAFDDERPLYTGYVNAGEIYRHEADDTRTLLATLPGRLGNLLWLDDRLLATSFDTHRIFTVTREGTVEVWAGRPRPGDADGTGEEARFESPNGLLRDGDTLYVTESRRARLGSAPADPVGPLPRHAGLLDRDSVPGVRGAGLRRRGLDVRGRGSAVLVVPAAGRAPMLGRWSDRVGRKPVLVLSQLGTFVAWAVFLVALALPKEPLAQAAGATLTVPLLLVCVARALDGLTGGNMSVASAWVADLTCPASTA